MFDSFLYSYATCILLHLKGERKDVAIHRKRGGGRPLVMGTPFTLFVLLWGQDVHMSRAEVNLVKKK